MAHQVGKPIQKGWEWLTPSGSTRWFSHAPSERRKAERTAGKGLEALEQYKHSITGGGLEEGGFGRRAVIEKSYDEQQALAERGFDLRREGVGLQQQRLETQEATALDQFLGDAYSFRRAGDVRKATGGLYSGEEERGMERQEATMSRMMRGRQEGFDLAGQELSNQLQGLDIAQARSISDLLKARGVEMQGIEDLLYQIETERIAYEGV